MLDSRKIRVCDIRALVVKKSVQVAKLSISFNFFERRGTFGTMARLMVLVFGETNSGISVSSFP